MSKIEDVDLQDNQPQEQPDNSNEFEKPKPPKGYVAWVTAALCSAIATLFGVLWRSQSTAYETARADLKTEQIAHAKTKAIDSVKSAKYDQDLRNCGDMAFDDLEKKIQRAKQIESAMASKYAKVQNDIIVTKQTTEDVQKATADLKKVIKSSKK